MPQGKGTYGSKVGRPSKKQKKYEVGGTVEANFPMENEVISDINKMGQELESIPLNLGVESEFPIADARDRNEVSPDITEYNEGGKVQETNILDIVPKAEEYADIDKFNIEKYGQTWKQPYRKKRIEKMVGEVLSKKKKGKK